MRNHVFRIFRWLAAGGLLLVAACATNPVTGKKEFMLLSESDEERLGAESDKSIVAQYGVLDDPDLAAYVEGIGQRMVPVSHMPKEDFAFRVLDDPIVNAFALPGGYVYITRGILAYINDEAALAGIMGHEIGHVTARHGAQRYSQQAILGIGAGAVGAIFSDQPIVGDIAGAAGVLALLKYGRDDERQSDELGVEYATKIGYDTRPMADFFRTLDVLSGGKRPPGWMSTHPDPGDRYNDVRRLTREWQAKLGGSSFKTDRNAHLRRLAGLAFGENPRHGTVRGGEFIHPDLSFRFPMPQGWKYLNAAAAVQMAEPDGNAIILFEVEGEESNPTSVANAFVERNSIAERSRETRSIGGLSAVEVLGSITGKSGVIGILSTFIGKDAKIFAFHGMCADADMTKYRSVFSRIAGGFARLEDKSLLGLQPVEIQIVEAGRTASFRDLVSAYPIPEEAALDLAGLALLNGFEVGANVPRGTLLKVLRVRSGSP